MGSTFKVKRNDSKPFTLSHKNKGVLIDTTGYVYNLQVREAVPDTSITDDTGSIISKEVAGNSEGTMTFDITKEDTNITPKVYLYDIQYTKPDGSNHSSQTGKFIVEADISRAEVS